MASAFFGFRKPHRLLFLCLNNIGWLSWVSQDSIDQPTTCPPIALEDWALLSLDRNMKGNVLENYLKPFLLLGIAFRIKFQAGDGDDPYKTILIKLLRMHRLLDTGNWTWVLTRNRTLWLSIAKLMANRCNVLANICPLSKAHFARD